jgi:alpha-galactosidase
MADALRATGRDIALSISGSDPFALAHSWRELTQCWRTTDDIFDTWSSIMRIGFGPQDRWPAFSGPGHWADADMLVVGMVGWGPNLHYTRLTPDEQYTHISLWSLFSSPMLIGCDIAQMDDFTLSLLCNHEVNDIMQDPLGMRAVPYFRGDGYVVYVKILENGNLAVGLFNTSTKPQKIGFTPRTLGLWSKEITIRDVWRQKDVAKIGPRDRYEEEIAPHGCSLLIVSPPNTMEKIVDKPYVIEQ